MIEIHLCDDGEQPRVIRSPGEKTLVRVSQYMAADEILSKLEIELTKDEYQSFFNLWSNDSHPRVFNKQGKYLVIKDKT